MNEWLRTCSISRQGERLVLPLLSQLGQVIEMKGDHEITLINQRAGVDFVIAHSMTGLPLFCELKTEETTSPNIYLEVVQNRDINSIGWWKTIRSDLLTWCFLDTLGGYIVKVHPLREWVSRQDLPLKEPETVNSAAYLASWLSISSGVGPGNIQPWNYYDSDHELQQKLTIMNLL